jgi:uncharacterized damage-inducible protein DinB
MAIKDGLLPEFDHEMATTRKVIERVNGEKLTWQPHERSMTLGRLATHVAEIPRWGFTILNDAEYNIVPSEYKPTKADTVAEMLAIHDEAIAKVRAILDSKTDAEFMAPWTFKQDGKVIMTLPRVVAFRSWVMNHVIHHRGQLSVYLRQTGSLVPSIYGPSGDER